MQVLRWTICRSAFAVAALLPCPVRAGAAETEKRFCIYQKSDGSFVQTKTEQEVPIEHRARARCFSPSSNTHLAQPEDIPLGGTVRSERMASSVGPIDLRWPRRVEGLFGRTPSRAMAEAAGAASRALRRPGFPAALQALNINWEVVFMDERLPEKQIPAYLINNCHPGWMTAPANIYIVAQRVAMGCGGRSGGTMVADAQLAEVLLHEMGHAIEFQLLGPGGGSDRMRSEGFATWFQSYAADFSTLIDKHSVRQREFSLARAATSAGKAIGEKFDGSARDYAWASLFFHAIVARRNVTGLVRVYDEMRQNGSDFFSAAERELGWDKKRFEGEVERLLQGSA